LGYQLNTTNVIPPTRGSLQTTVLVGNLLVHIMTRVKGYTPKWRSLHVFSI